MNEAENKIKAQIVEKIKASTNILVTVSKDPSVDELSAAIGLTAFLNKLDKHTTAIFSGILPPAITFLEPDKVFENTADSLRDFIIALDKEKADHLRYKVEGDVVKIFITPYRTTITSDDLEFSQGDYNVDLVLALGVVNQDHLDTALSAQGQILHDVTIATFSAGEQASQLGSMDWRDSGASGFSEMVSVISESLKTDKAIVDKQIATALLTGIVSSTERFSNPKTSSRVMTTAAQLMAAGADQQLIAAKLQESHEINALPSIAKESTTAASAPVDIPAFAAVEEPAVAPAPVDAGSLVISHDEPVVPEVVTTMPAPEIVTQPTVGPAIQENTAPKIDSTAEPLLGGILSATSDQAAEDARRELDEQQNKTILSHSYIGGSDESTVAPINGVGQTEDTKMIDIFSDAPVSTIPAPITPSVAGLPLPPPVPDFSTLPPTAALPELGIPIPEPPFPSASTLPINPPPSSTDPTQFKIPGQ